MRTNIITGFHKSVVSLHLEYPMQLRLPWLKKDITQVGGETERGKEIHPMDGAPFLVKKAKKAGIV